MPRPSDIKNLIISGAFISILIIVASVTIFMLNKENPFFSQKIYIQTEVKSAQNLKPGAAIQLRGIKVGSVESINFKDLNSLIIRMGILNEYKDWIRVDSQVSFKTQGVLGDRFLEISGGSQNAAIVSADYILKAEENNQLDQIITKSEDLILVASSILTKFDRILTKVQPDHFEKILLNLENLTANTNRLMSTVSDKNLSSAINNLKNTSDHLAQVSSRIEKGPGTLHSLIYDQTLHEDLKSLMGGANRSKVLKYFIRESIKKNEPESKE